MLGSFPNATSVSLGRSSRIPVRELFERLTSLRCLKSLAFGTGNISHDGRAPPCLQSMAQLTDLCIFDGVHYLSDNLIASVKHLTNLTRLCMHARPTRREIYPFVELQKIQDLDVNAVTLFNKHEEILFPSLTNLTQLSFEATHAADLVLLLFFEVRISNSLISETSLHKCLAGH